MLVHAASANSPGTWNDRGIFAEDLETFMIVCPMREAVKRLKTRIQSPFAIQKEEPDAHTGQVRRLLPGIVP